MGKVGQEDRHGGERSLLEDGTGPCEEGRVSLDKVSTISVTWPFFLLGNREGNNSAPFPSIAQACVQSSGVLALHPSKRVRTSPPPIASAGSSGTAVVQSAVTHSSADFAIS